MHRYIDNGGNIYEIYDYVEAHPELAFMKEAEKLQPESFDRIKKRQLSFRYSDFGMYAYLGYLEILEKNGYANMAVFGTAANQYAKMAFYKKSIIEAQSNGEAQEYPQYSQKEVDRDREKALVFAEKASTLLLKLVTDPNSIADDSQSLDKVYASEQYASALRYLEALGASVSYKPNAMLSFIFSMSYAYKNVPELYLHVSLSNASTLLLKDSVPVSEIRNAVYPFLDIRNPLHKRSGIVERVLRSRLERGGTRFQEMDLYSWKNVSELGMRVPEFKSWLMENGWKNSDFK
ncbi:MAG: hypothetical protein ACEQSB_03445 [Undibacterium sp.]